MKRVFVTSPLLSLVKTLCIFFTVCVIAGSLSGCAVSSKNSIGSEYDSEQFDSQFDIIYGQDTPVRIGSLGTMHASFARSYTFSEAYEEADLVVDIIITEWLCELDDSHINRYEEAAIGETTYFKAKIIKEYKNNTLETLDEFVLLQYGNNSFTYFQYPLFKNGDRLLLCLNAYDDEIFTNGYEDCFIIVGEQLTEMQFIEDSNEAYLLKRNDYYGNFTDLEPLATKNSRVNSRIIDKAYAYDNILSEASVVLKSSYPLNDIVQYMERMDENNL